MGRKIATNVYKAGRGYQDLDPSKPSTEIKFVGTTAVSTLTIGQIILDSQAASALNTGVGYVLQGEAYAGPAVQNFANFESLTAQANTLGTTAQVLSGVVDRRWPYRRTGKVVRDGERPPTTVPQRRERQR